MENSSSLRKVFFFAKKKQYFFATTLGIKVGQVFFTFLHKTVKHKVIKV